jgi:polyphosphate kinase 2
LGAKKRAKRNGARANGEVRADALEEVEIEGRWQVVGPGKPLDSPKDRPKVDYRYVDELVRLQFELIKLQEWVRIKGLKVAVIFEGRDAAGKGGVIKRIAEALNPRICRIVALAAPTEKERGQWYFQRYVAHLPSRGEIVLFDRSWYNRAGVEHVMGFCTQAEYEEFLVSCPLFEEMLLRRFLERMRNPIKRWKLSPMDLKSREKWVEYSKAKDVMLAHTDTKLSPWYMVDADNKKQARLNCIAHVLHQVPYKDLRPVEIALPARQPEDDYKRPKRSTQNWVTTHFA